MTLCFSLAAFRILVSLEFSSSLLKFCVHLFWSIHWTHGGAHIMVVMENGPATDTVFNLPSLPCFRNKQTCVCSSQVELSLPTALLLVPQALQPAKGAYLPYVRPQGWGVQYVAQTTDSPGRVSIHVISLFL